MASTGAALLVLLVISSWAFASAASIDGRPRPANFADEPTVTYDGTPTLTDENGPVNCIWYGFANTLYDAPTTTNCLSVLRLALTNETVNPPANMEPYVYYTLKRLIDPTNNESYCYQGCFNLGTSAASPPLPAGESPLPAGAPPLYEDGEPTLAPAAAPPLTTEAPPPVTFGVPPSSSFSPAPSLFPGAPPPGTEEAPPVGAALPPASIFPPPGAAPELSTPAPLASPPAPTTASPVGSSGAFLQPTALFSALGAFAAILVAA